MGLAVRRCVVVSVVVFCSAWAAEMRFERLRGVLDPMPRTAGLPDLTGLWAGPPGAVMDVDTVPPPDPGSRLGAALAEKNRTLTGFWSGGPPVVLRRDSGVKVLPSAALRERMRDRVRWRRGEADGPEDRNLWERCISRGLPLTALPAPQADRWLIVQTASVFVVLSETLHEFRVFNPQGRAGSSSVPGGRLGVSRARRVGGGGLEVVTTRIRGVRERGGPPAADPMPGAHPGPSASLEIVETWTPRHRDRIDYVMRVHDPKTYRRPVTYGFALRREPPGAALYEYACHEGNRSMELVLRGARADEAASLYGSRVGAAERAWFGRPGSAGPRRAFDDSIPLAVGRRSGEF